MIALENRIKTLYPVDVAGVLGLNDAAIMGCAEHGLKKMISISASKPNPVDEVFRMVAQVSNVLLAGRIMRVKRSKKRHRPFVRRCNEIIATFAAFAAAYQGKGSLLFDMGSSSVKWLHDAHHHVDGLLKYPRDCIYFLSFMGV